MKQSNYKYINKFFANANCTGKSTTKLSYEHFIVYWNDSREHRWLNKYEKNISYLNNRGSAGAYWNNNGISQSFTIGDCIPDIRKFSDIGLFYTINAV